MEVHQICFLIVLTAVLEFDIDWTEVRKKNKYITLCQSKHDKSEFIMQYYYYYLYFYHEKSTLRLKNIFRKNILAKIVSSTIHMGLTDNIHPSIDTYKQTS